MERVFATLQDFGCLRKGNFRQDPHYSSQKSLANLRKQRQCQSPYFKTMAKEK